MEKNNKYISMIVASLTLLLLVFGATYAYFAVGVSFEDYSTNISADAEEVGAVSLEAGSSLYLEVSTSDMEKQENDVVYYATEDGTPQTEENTIPLAKVNAIDDKTYTCKYTLNIAYEGDMKNVLPGEGSLILNVGGVDYDIYSSEFPMTISGILSGISSDSQKTIDGSLRMINLSGTDQSAMAGTSMLLTFTATEFDCSNEYNISYELGGGRFEEEQPTSYAENTETFTLGIPVRETYTFLGWTGSNGTTPEINVTIDKGSTGDKSYTANWEKQILYLYDSGTINPVAGSVTRSNTYCNFSLLESQLYAWSIQPYDSFIYFSNKIDLTYYDTLYFVGSMSRRIAGELVGVPKFGVWSSLSLSASGKVLDGPVDDGTYTLDVSDLNGEYYVGFYVKGWAEYAQGYMSKLYLE